MKEKIVKLVHAGKTVAGKEPHPNTYVQLVRSLVVSVVALVFDFSTMVLLKEKAGINYLLAATIGFTVGVTVNYFLSVFWVFTNRKFISAKIEFILFVVICTIGLVLNLIIISLLVEQLRVDYRLAKLFATVAVFFWNFIARKKILY